jgi:thiol-disulfide isomerase/thioredoxin
MLELGTLAPDFTLPGVVTSDPLPGPTRDTPTQSIDKPEPGTRPLLVMFICNHCPYVVHVAAELARIGHDYSDRVDILAINANDADAYPGDSPDRMKAMAQEHHWSFPYLHDETQAVAKAYTAACTPDFFLFDKGHRLAYRGQLDASRPHRVRSGVYDSSESQPSGDDLRAAVEAVLAGDTPSEKQSPSMGCNIKWKPGNEPGYAG